MSESSNDQTKHILTELQKLVNNYGKYHAVKLDAYYNQLSALKVDVKTVESFVNYWIDNEKQFPAYCEILTYVNSHAIKPISSYSHTRCGLCGNYNNRGMWELLRSDGHIVAAACICNKEQSKSEWDKYDPNNPPIFNGEIRYMELSSF